MSHLSEIGLLAGSFGLAQAFRLFAICCWMPLRSLPAMANCHCSSVLPVDMFGGDEAVELAPTWFVITVVLPLVQGIVTAGRIN